MMIFFQSSRINDRIVQLVAFLLFPQPTCGQLYQYWLLDPMYIHTCRDSPIPFLVKGIHFLDASWNSNFLEPSMFLVVFGNSDTPQVEKRGTWKHSMESFRREIYVMLSILIFLHCSDRPLSYRGDPSIQLSPLAIFVAAKKIQRREIYQTPLTFGRIELFRSRLGQRLRLR